MKKISIRLTLETKEYIDIELYPEFAPITVDNFLNLIDKSYYDGLIFHRIIKGFMAQGGGYTFDDATSSLGYPKVEAEKIKGEFKSNGVNNPLQHKLGIISMARTNEKDSATSQFFICTADAPHLDGEYAAFGKVIGENSYKVLETLNNHHVVNAGNGFTTFPYPIIRIESIRRS